MEIFAESATSFIASRPDAASRAVAWTGFETAGLPQVSDEVWRYAPLGDLELDRFAVATEPLKGEDSNFAKELCRRAGLVVRVTDGFCVDNSSSIDGVTVDVDESSTSLGGE
ncbi:MAG: hypothetical protein ABSE75_09530, partial [Acidimicrobiales bacterium]